MKAKNTLTYAIILICLIFFACDEKYNHDIHSSEFNPFNNTFYVGDTAHEYYNYEPDIEIDLDTQYYNTVNIYRVTDGTITITYTDPTANFSDNFYPLDTTINYQPIISLDTIDIDQDGKFDFSICSSYGRSYDTIPQQVPISEKSFYLRHLGRKKESVKFLKTNTDEILLGDILYDILKWNIYEEWSGYNRYDETYLLMHANIIKDLQQWEWDKEEYYCFKNEAHNKIAWVRMEFVSNRNVLLIKDCGIERK